MLAGLVKAVEDDAKLYSYSRTYGIRALTDDENYEIGDSCRHSYDWDHENRISTYITTGEKAGGTCCVRVSVGVDEDIATNLEKALSLVGYYGDTFILLSGEYDASINYAVDDENEARLVDAVVIAKVEVK
jgi:hypothetical protein